MRIEASFKAKLNKFTPYYDKDTNSRSVTLELRTRVPEDKAKKLLGADFYDAVFGSMKKHPDESITFAWRKTLQPAVVLEQHRVKVLGFDYVCTPERPVVHEIEGESAVELVLRLPLPGENLDFAGKVMCSYKDELEVSMAWMQGVLPIVEQTKKRVIKRGPRNFGNNKPTTAGEDAPAPKKKS